MDPDVGAPLTRASVISPPSSPPPSRPKSSLFSRLRRSPSPSFSGAPPISIPMKHSLSSQDRGPTSYKKSQVGVPIMMGRNRSEEVFGSRKNGMALEDEVEWERVRTLPRVRLVPPEDEGEPIMLYPPPHFLRPATPPPILPHPFLSPPNSPPTSPPNHRTTSPPSLTSPPRRPGSIYSTNPTWAGMAEGFILPPPKFQRARSGWGGAPAGVIMPKKRAEVAEDRRRRMSGISMTGWNDVDDGAPRSPPRKIRALESEEEIAANWKAKIQEAKEHEQEEIMMGSQPVSDEHPAGEIETTPAPASVMPALSDETADPFGVAIAAAVVLPPDIEASGGPSQSVESTDPKSVRNSRALSLSAATSSHSSLSLVEQASVPSVPSSTSAIRKQKSLKTLFFSSSTPADTASSTALTSASVTSISLPKSSSGSGRRPMDETERPKERGRGILSRARSKPSLKIDVKMTKGSGEKIAGSSSIPTTPSLSTGRSGLASSSFASTPASYTNSPHTAASTPRGLSKRFSLSNMSNAFKKRSSSTPVTGSLMKDSSAPVPTVPALPEMYKKEKEARKVIPSAVPIGPSKAPPSHGPGEENDSALNDTPTRCESPIAMDEPAPSDAVTDSATSFEKGEARLSFESTGSRRVNPLAPLLPALDLSTTTTPLPDTPTTVSATSMDDYEEESEEIIHAQLMQVTPRTRRNPGSALQEFLGSGPAKQGNVVIVPQNARRSVEAVVVLGGRSTSVFNNRAILDGSEENVNSTTRVIEERRGSTDTDETDIIVTPVHNALEIFVAPDPGAFDQPSASAVSSPQIDTLNDDDLESLPSDTVLVENPPPPPPSSETSTAVKGDSTSVPKGRFASPEALLRRLHTSSRKQQSTPYHSQVREPGVLAPGAGIPVPPIPFPLEGCIPSEAYSSLMNDVQLRSLHFEGLGLDFGEWGDEMERGSVRVRG
ncbi:hypothetical protein IAR55_005259 [Kwoniella newhampshirensis]|uniref:Uncharacterized protein n=1 Tax=Kwoniella newhampshirensis TaxID=1651941 RepID=A0AAW0YI03_9TREE